MKLFLKEKMSASSIPCKNVCGGFKISLKEAPEPFRRPNNLLFLFC